MTANAEARALLDQLMGVERDALLPAGAALPRKNKRPLDGAGGGGMVLPGAKRTRSCYDRDIDPLYCAWGVDVYELFVNTKSDIGPNPYKVDDSAREEYLKLPPGEKDQLGYEHRLFVKLQELVQVCDRTVHRNHEKLKRELQRQSQKRGGNDYVLDVSAEKVEELVRAELQLEDTKEELKTSLKTLQDVQGKEDAVLETQRAEQQKHEQEANEKEGESKDEPKDEADVKTEDVKTEDAKTEGVKTEDVKKEDGGESKPEESKEDEAPVKTEEGDATMVIDRAGVDEEKEQASEEKPPAPPAMSPEAIEELAKLALQKQELLCKIATIVTQIGPLEESVHVMTLKLNFVRSDTTTDKTVCEVSGNFMSARDADERIAAHYAGKQYVGWKLVRDKLAQMIQKHGRHGPPRGHGPPDRRGGGGPPLMSHQKYMQQGNGGGGDRYGGGGGNYHRGGGGGRYDDRRRGSDSGRWERGGGGYHSRDNRYDDRRRGDRYGGGRRDSHHRGGGGYGRR